MINNIYTGENHMKKLWIIGIFAALALIVFGVAGFAYAQSQNPRTPSNSTSYGRGMMGAGARSGNAGRGMMGAGVQSGNAGQAGNGMMGNSGANQNGYACPFADGDESGNYGPLHTYMLNAFAQALGLTPEELNTRLQAGDTLWVIAQEKGMTAEQFQAMVTTARTTALNQAVTDGVITQAQADSMLQRMNTMMGNGFGPGYGGMMNGGNGAGRSNNQP
jgi:hypothetical protein